jgi:hypothetical protein
MKLKVCCGRRAPPFEDFKHTLRDEFVDVKIKSADPRNPLSAKQLVWLQDASNVAFEESVQSSQLRAPTPHRFKMR